MASETIKRCSSLLQKFRTYSRLVGMESQFEEMHISEKRATTSYQESEKRVHIRVSLFSYLTDWLLPEHSNLNLGTVMENLSFSAIRLYMWIRKQNSPLE